MTGVPLVVGDAPAEPRHRFQAALRGLHRSVLRHQPSFLLILRLLLVYAVPIIDLVFEAMSAREQWLASEQVLVHRIILESLGICQSLLLNVLYGGAGNPRFFTPLLYELSKLRYIKGIYSCINSRSALAHGMTRHVLHSDLPRPMRRDWDSAREWLQEYWLQIVPADSPLLSPTAVETNVLRQMQGPVIVITPGSQAEQARGWAVVLMDPVGIVASAHSGALIWCGFSTAAAWCAKELALWLLQTLDIAPKDLCGIIADNLASSFGTTGGSPSHCVWVDAMRRHYGSSLANGPIKEFYVPAQHDMRRLDLVAGWQAEADPLAKAGLRLARARVIPIPSLLGDLHLLHCEGRLVCNLVSTLDALYTQTCQECAPSPHGYDTACCERCLLTYLLPNRALNFASCLRMAPNTHVSPKADLHCYLCRAPCHSWGQHLYSDCMSAALACLHGFKTLSPSGCVTTTPEI